MLCFFDLGRTESESSADRDLIGGDPQDAIVVSENAKQNRAKFTPKRVSAVLLQ